MAVSRTKRQRHEQHAVEAQGCVLMGGKQAGRLLCVYYSGQRQARERVCCCCLALCCWWARRRKGTPGTRASATSQSLEERGMAARDARRRAGARGARGAAKQKRRLGRVELSRLHPSLSPSPSTAPRQEDCCQPRGQEKRGKHTSRSCRRRSSSNT